ncbi:putative ferric-chelate reductase 1 [Parambassis ranga]|uniref:Ferric-chelate reductase 1 n=1 Tax=Parambassis ranga TaxID=210632 RepID=A0A6P7K1G2_9TELE|nr:putative ferric-chelate reductase 1 [Parambassis ranga]
MERGSITSVATLVLFMAVGVQGASNTTQVSIARTGCGVSKLCVETPRICDPAGTGPCLFTSINTTSRAAPNGSALSFALSGNSSGYIAVGLTVNASQGFTMLFVCAQNSSNNGSFLFLTVNRNNSNNELSSANRTVTEIRSQVVGEKIQCEFNVPNVNATQSRNQDTTFSVLLGSGPLRGDGIGTFNVSLTTGLLNIADPTSNVLNATQAPNVTTTSGASDAFHSHAVLLLLTVPALSFLKSA